MNAFNTFNIKLNKFLNNFSYIWGSTDDILKNVLTESKSSNFFFFWLNDRHCQVDSAHSRFYIEGWTLLLVLRWKAPTWARFEVWVSLHWACYYCNYDISGSLRSRDSCRLVLSGSLIVASWDQSGPRYANKRSYISWVEAHSTVGLTRRQISRNNSSLLFFLRSIGIFTNQCG